MKNELQKCAFCDHVTALHLDIKMGRNEISLAKAHRPVTSLETGGPPTGEVQVQVRHGYVTSVQREEDAHHGLGLQIWNPSLLLCTSSLLQVGCSPRLKTTGVPCLPRSEIPRLLFPLWIKAQSLEHDFKLCLDHVNPEGFIRDYF